MLSPDFRTFMPSKIVLLPGCFALTSFCATFAASFFANFSTKQLDLGVCIHYLLCNCIIWRYLCLCFCFRSLCCCCCVLAVVLCANQLINSSWQKMEFCSSHVPISIFSSSSYCLPIVASFCCRPIEETTFHTCFSKLYQIHPLFSKNFDETCSKWSECTSSEYWAGKNASHTNAWSS